MHETCKRFISKGAKFPCKAVLKIYDIYTDKKAMPLDHLLQDNAIFQLIQNHCPGHLEPAHGNFYENVGEAHKFFFSKHQDSTYFHKAITLGCPNISVKDKIAKAVKQSARSKTQKRHLDVLDSSEEDNVEDKKVNKDWCFKMLTK